MLLTLLVSAAAAAVDVRCEPHVGDPAPTWYTTDQAQIDFWANRTALSTSFSPLHGAFPADPGHVRLELEAMVVPPLSCARRFYENQGSTLDSNHTPVVPRLRVGFTSQKLGAVVVYGSAGFTPPIPLGGATSLVASGEAGIGIPVSEKTAVSVRGHFSSNRTNAHVLPPSDPQKPFVADFFDGQAYGVDGMASFKAGSVEPYLMFGYVNTTTYLWRGEDSRVLNNYNPVSGMELAAGFQVDGKVGTGAVEFYAVPGILYTGRASIGVQF